MTDKQALSAYRLQRAEETLGEAERMLQLKFSAASVANRAYYSMFYAVWALLLRTDIDLKTVKHGGIIALFDKLFVHAGKIDGRYSKMLHEVFLTRQKGDYKEMVALAESDAVECAKQAREFITEIKSVIQIDSST